MSQNTIVVVDGTGLEVLEYVNDALNTVITNNSGSSAPAETYAFMLWADTTNDLLKLRNAANTAWIEVGTLSSANLGLVKSSDIGATVQAYDADLEAIADSSVGNQIVSYATNGVGFVNKVINGSFIINQRGVGGTVTLSAGSYGHDRWKAGSSGCTYTFSTVNGLTTINISSGSLQQVIESNNVPNGTNTLCLSWSGTAQGKIASGSYSSSGVTASVSGGSNLTIEFNTGTLTNVQLEKGSVATPFEVRSFGQELLLCQRYYQVGNIRVNLGVFTTGIGQAQSIQFTVPLRASPSISVTPSDFVSVGFGAQNAIDIDSAGFGYLFTTASSVNTIGAGRLSYTISAEL